ncbi:MAG: ribosome recycling factor [Candidatus Moranbacteria bacterium]|nr:ribosome recycling factor [Candidatus Moranbacteria bacterium]
MYKKIIEDNKSRMDDNIDHLNKEFSKLRTGRANPALVEEISVNYYGTATPLKQVANISIPEARQIVIQPWDKAAMDDIETAINNADIGVTPSNDGDSLRITLPPMTEENRKDLVKVLNNIAEESRVTVRNIREDVWKSIQEAEKNGEIAEDDKFAGKDALQKVVDEYNDKIESLRKQKEDDVMTV